MAVHQGRIFTVGTTVSAFHWEAWEAEHIAEGDGRGAGAKCAFIKNEKEEFGFFFLSGDFFSLATASWSKYSTPAPSFNIASLNKKATMIGLAYQNMCGEAG